MAFTFNTNSVPATGGFAIFILRATLVAAGWVSTQDSDGTTYSASGTQLTGGNSGANGLGNTNAWFVLQAPAVNGQQRSICFQRGTVNYNWRIKYSPSAGFVGGAPSATQVPSATDEAIAYGGGTDASPTFSQLLYSIEGGYRFNMVAGDTTVGYAWYFDAFITGNAASTHWAMTMEVMSPGSFPSADTDPAIIYITTPGGSSSAWGTDWWDSTLNTHGFLNNGTPTWISIDQLTYYDAAFGIYGFPGYASGQGVGQNSWTTKDDLVPPAYARHATATPPTGYKGYGSLIKFASTFRGNYDTLSVAAPGAKDYVFVNGVALPWDGSVPLI